jgi:SAM-dependent methyltransferase
VRALDSTGRGRQDKAGRKVTLLELCGMPVMSTVERAACRSLPWRLFTRRVVVPWAIGPIELRGEILELGSGSGAMAEQLLERYPTIRVTATDVDPAMRAAATRRLERFGDRVRVQEADATRLPFGDASFDGVVSFIMLHHVIAWEDALAEAARVLRPGGTLAGYDLMRSGPNRLLHRRDESRHRLATADALRSRLAELPLAEVSVRPGLGGTVARFRGQRSGVQLSSPRMNT